MVSDAFSEPPANKSRSIAAVMIGAADNANLAAKITITQEDLSVASYKKRVESALSETLKAYYYLLY